MMERIVPVICAGEIEAWLVAWLGLWAAPIIADPAWQGGAYAPEAQPLAGLTLALKLITLQANHWLWTDAQFGRACADPDAPPGAALGNNFKVEAALTALAAARAKISDANHLLYLVKANQIFAAGPSGTLADLEHVRARTLLLYSPEDQVFRAERSRATAAAIAKGGPRSKSRKSTAPSAMPTASSPSPRWARGFGNFWRAKSWSLFFSEKSVNFSGTCFKSACKEQIAVALTHRTQPQDNGSARQKAAAASSPCEHPVAYL